MSGRHLINRCTADLLDGLILSSVTPRQSACSFRGPSYGSGQFRAGARSCQSDADLVCDLCLSPRRCKLVARFSQIEGYKCLSLTRALDVVKCQLALA